MSRKRFAIDRPISFFSRIFHASGPLPENGRLGPRLGAKAGTAGVRYGGGFESAVQSTFVRHVSHVYHPQVRPLAVEMMLDSLPRAKRITAVGARTFRGNRWGEILGKPPFRCLKPAFLWENVGESQFYPVLKPLPAAAFPATEKAHIPNLTTLRCRPSSVVPFGARSD